MAARDRYTKDFTCPQCQRTGTADVSEDDHPYMRDPGLWIDELPRGFSTPDSSPIYHTKAFVFCEACRYTFPLFPKWVENMKAAIAAIPKRPTPRRY